MAHPDESLIRAYLDGELDEAEADSFRSHFPSCPDCQAEVRLQEEATAQLSGALLLLDHEPSVPEARARVQAWASGDRARQERAPHERTSRWGLPGSLLKVASIALIFTAAAASALPGSPVREWLTQGWNALVGLDEPETAVQEGRLPAEGDRAGASEPSSSETWTKIVPQEGSVEFGLFDLPEGAEIRVFWVDGDQAGIFAGEGTRFRTDSGRLEAHSPPGGVRVEVPTSLSRVLLTLDGRVLLRKSGSEVETLGAIQSQTPREIVFGPGLPQNEG
jgi:hypothetical protein